MPGEKILKERPIRSFLSERPTLILDKPLLLELERRKIMLKYYEPIEAPALLPPFKGKESRRNPDREDKSKAEYWIELLRERAVFARGLDKPERARRALNLLYESGHYLELMEFTKFAKRWSELTAPLAEPL